MTMKACGGRPDAIKTQAGYEATPPATRKPDTQIGEVNLGVGFEGFGVNMVLEGLQEDMGEGSMQCIDHPYKNNTPGGICAFCLQEKLGKLVSSSFPIAVFPSSSSSSSPSFRSDFGTGGSSTSTLPVRPTQLSTSNTRSLSNNTNCHYHHQDYSRRTKLPFLLIQRKKKKKDLAMNTTPASDHHSSIVFKRSKSTTTPRHGMHFTGHDNADDYSPHKRRFWSFLHLPKHSTPRKTVRSLTDISSNTLSASTIGSFSHHRDKKKEDFPVVDENESPNQASFDRKVSRSRSVGCGSRSFSGDFFERISTGFGDCTLRRVESQREGKSKGTQRNVGQDCIKERVKCGGLFSGFMITSSSSSSSSSSYWVSSSTEDNTAAKPGLAVPPVAGPQLAHGRSKSWGWAFASPIRAFSKPSTGKREGPSKNPQPNLAAIPSLLAVRG
ncbi:hypothetical protein RJ640_014791 [Escallonia rubra]|uniref:Uncharacterized protein n=1 Tax=Escallonia rubra TaxID=112253 RepID=A0AA88UV54_9ASTE|nr:hypothetical protein RJ640_014791 [Escallonia rubra]